MKLTSTWHRVWLETNKQTKNTVFNQVNSQVINYINTQGDIPSLLLVVWVEIKSKINDELNFTHHEIK